MTESDLQALGIWWIPLMRPARGAGPVVNAWAIEDADGGITLFGCGSGSSESLTALANGLAEASATLRDVRRVILSHAGDDHASALRWIIDNAAGAVEVVASGPVRAQLAIPLSASRELCGGERLAFRHFTATALRCAGHVPALACLYAEREGLLFSSDHLIDDPGTYARLACASAQDLDLDAYRASLEWMSGLRVSVVLPGRGPPFAGHRRAIREAITRLTPPRVAPERTGPAPVARAAVVPRSTQPAPSEVPAAGTARFARRVPQSPQRRNHPNKEKHG